MNEGTGRRIDALLRRVSRLEQPTAEIVTAIDSPDILAAMTDPTLFGREFGGPSWAPWRAFLGAFFGLPLDDEQLALYRAHTGRSLAPESPSREAWVIAGRRAGKSRVAALVATYLAGFRDYSAVLSAGEQGTLMVLAADTRQARIVQSYVRGLFERVPALRRLVRKWRLEAVELANGVTVEIHAASFRGVRGYSLIGCICDEVSFWRSDEGSANYDREVIDALRPGLITTGGPLLAITTAYARRGEAWRHYDEHFGRERDSVLVWKAPTVDMNPTVDAALIEEARARDPVSASAEYDSEFRRDLETFVAPEVVAQATVPGRRELAYRSGVRYVAFTDPSGGAADSYALAIAHEEGGVAVLDVVREIRAPFSPDAATAEYAGLIRNYGMRAVGGDYYSAEWVVERFRQHGVSYERSLRAKSDLYGELLGPLNSGRVRLLDEPVLKAQLLALERRTSRGGRDSIDHPPRGRDDVANAAAGALVGVLDPAGRCTVGGFRFEL